MPDNNTETKADLKFSLCTATFVASQLSFSANGVHLYTNIVVITLNILLSIFGTFENILVLAAYVVNNRLKTSSNFLLVVLAVSDLLITAIVQPLFCVQKLSEILGKDNCYVATVVEAVTYCCCGFSLTTIVILSVERFITLAYPYRYQIIVNPTRLKLTVAVSWLAILTGVMSRFGLITSTMLYYGIAVITIAVGVTTVVSIWIWIHLLINRHKKRIENSQKPTNILKENVNRQKMLRTTKTSYLIIAALFLCYACSFMLSVYFTVKPANFIVNYLLTPWVSTILYSNSALNPLLLFWRKTIFRETARRLLCKTTTLKNAEVKPIV